MVGVLLEVCVDDPRRPGRCPRRRRRPGGALRRARPRRPHPVAGARRRGRPRRDAGAGDDPSRAPATSSGPRAEVAADGEPRSRCSAPSALRGVVIGASLPDGRLDGRDRSRACIAGRRGGSTSPSTASSTSRPTARRWWPLAIALGIPRILTSGGAARRGRTASPASPACSAPRPAASRSCPAAASRRKRLPALASAAAHGGSRRRARRPCRAPSALVASVRLPAARRPTHRPRPASPRCARRWTPSLSRAACRRRRRSRPWRRSSATRCTVDRAGGASMKCFSKTALNEEKSRGSSSQQVTCTTSASVHPAASSTERRFAITCSVCGDDAARHHLSAHGRHLPGDKDEVARPNRAAQRAAAALRPAGRPRRSGSVACLAWLFPPDPSTQCHARTRRVNDDGHGSAAGHSSRLGTTKSTSRPAPQPTAVPAVRVEVDHGGGAGRELVEVGVARRLGEQAGAAKAPIPGWWPSISTQSDVRRRPLDDLEQASRVRRGKAPAGSASPPGPPRRRHAAPGLLGAPGARHQRLVGTEALLFSQPPISAAARRPRLLSGRSRSRWPGSAQLNLAWRIRIRRRMPSAVP